MSTAAARASNAHRLVQPGLYRATMTGTSRYRNAYGERIGFDFTLDGAEGVRIRVSAAPHLSPKSKLVEIVQGLLGRDLSERELAGAINYQALVGSRCAVVVVTGSDRAGNPYSTIGHILPHEQISG